MTRYKKGISLLFVVCFALSMSFGLNAAFASSPSPNTDLDDESSASASSEPEKPSVDVSSDFCILIDADTGTVLFEKDAYAKAYPASTTKIMTGYLVSEMMTSLDEIVECGAEVNGFSEQNIRIGLKQYEQVTIEDLLYGTMLPSGNDAAAALAVYFGGSIDGFAKLMNDKVKELGLEDTNFRNPHGLNNEEHYTTAYDLAQITRHALQNETFATVVSTPDYTLKKTNKRSEEKIIYNSNKFVTSKESEKDYHWSAVTGVKTGHTSAAQGCLVTSASKDGKNLVAVALHDTSKSSLARWDDCRKMLEFGFEELDTLSLDEFDFSPITTDVVDASHSDDNSGSLDLSLDTASLTISGLRDDLDSIRSNPAQLAFVPVVNQGKDLIAPVQKGQVVGSCAIKHGETVLAVVNLVASRDVLSIESDPTNPVGSLVTGITSSNEGISTTTLIIGIVAIVLVLAFIIFMIVRRRSRRNAPRFHARRRRSGYYNYHR